MNLTHYLQAGFPGLAVLTPEEARAEREIALTCQTLGRALYVWSASEGLIEIGGERRQDCPEPLMALAAMEPLLEDDNHQRVFLLRDIQPYFDQGDPLLNRRFRDLLRVAKSCGHAFILLGCRFKPPAELEHEITTIDMPLPSPEHLAIVLDGSVQSASLPELDPATREASIRAALGLTTHEAENAFALSVVQCRDIDPTVIASEKARSLKKGGLIEVIETRTSLADVGGLDALKTWLDGRARSFSEEARQYGLPAPKGLLIVGIPGTGKSLSAKATASAFGLPLLRLDMGRVFGGIVGQSEANLRTVIHTAEAIAPCVLWIDEIEKGFSGSKSSGSTDGGTSSRVFGSFLSWMQEKEKPVFVVATANDVSKLPPEFLRKGRFDEMFFVDLPDEKERAQIWEIVFRRYQRDGRELEHGALARASERFTGAEIEAAFVDAMHEAFAESREPSTTDVLAALQRGVPLASLMESQIQALREWSKGRARNAATRTTPPRNIRRLAQVN